MCGRKFGRTACVGVHVTIPESGELAVSAAQKQADSSYIKKRYRHPTVPLFLYEIRRCRHYSVPVPLPVPPLTASAPPLIAPPVPESVPLSGSETVPSSSDGRIGMTSLPSPGITGCVS